VHRPDDLKAALAEARAIIVRSSARVTADLLDAGPNLSVVGRLGVGLDNVDVDACAARGIAVRNSPGANAVSVGEYAVTATLMLWRGAYFSRKAMEAGDWPRQQLMGQEAKGHRLGIVGLGATGTASAERARAFGLEVAAVDPYLADDAPSWALAQRMDLPELLQWADAVTLHVPLTDETRNMIDASALAKMKPDAVLVNAARGGVVDERALAAALGSGHLSGAALDVFEEEPLSPMAAARFAGFENVLLTPHIAGVTEQANRRVSEATVRNVLNALRSGADG